MMMMAAIFIVHSLLLYGISKRQGMEADADADPGAVTTPVKPDNKGVLFGDDAVEARVGWHLTGTPLLLTAGTSMLSIHLTVHRGSAKEPKKPKPRVPDNGRFKIMQISDLHLSNGVGECREAVPNSYHDGKCEADPRTLSFVEKMLDEEKPDFVILGGDQVNGDTAPDAPTVSSPPCMSCSDQLCRATDPLW